MIQKYKLFYCEKKNRKAGYFKNCKLLFIITLALFLKKIPFKVLVNKICSNLF